ncbi:MULTISPECIES: PTS sugar transporter subunit IIB [Lacticaseibacillus]|uniref:PTS sugar transporter subunit IIB n=2 Tax=Lacticaseibacillus TaxID=2759736 RepID=A0ABW4CRM4_9LACO|nr:hypothetical protein [Lacticaseibacillus mingshuiensis]
MNIFVCCAGGGSSSLFCQRMATGFQQHDPNLSASFTDAQAMLTRPTDFRADLNFAYGGEGAIRPDTAFEMGTVFDAVLVAPQVRYRTPFLKQMLHDYPIVVADIPGRLFGMMDAVKGADLLRGVLITLDLMHGYQSGFAFGSKRGDKDLELLVYGTASQSKKLQQALTLLKNRGIMPLCERFDIDALYDFHPQRDFDVRMLFGAVFKNDAIAKVARRVDGVVLFEQNPHARRQPQWYDDYRIPSRRLAMDLLNDKADPHVLADQLLDFLLEVDLVAEATSGVSVARFETPPPPRVRKHFGIFSWYA